MLATVLLLGLLLVATVTDLLRQKIYNWTTYPGILAALCLNAAVYLGGLANSQGQQQLQWWVGYVGFGESLIGLLACGFLMLVCYVMLKLGGGDVKLMAMVGAFLGLEKGFEAMLWTFVLGMCLALIVLIWRVGPLPLVARTFRQVMWTLRFGRWSPLSEEERIQLQSPLFLADRRDQSLGDDTLQATGELCEDLRLLVLGKDRHDALHRLQRVGRVAGGDDQVTRLRGQQGCLRRLQVAHFADTYDVRILT